MARTKATGLLMPVRGSDPKYLPWSAATGALVPGILGQANTVEGTGQADDESDDAYVGFETTVIAIPAWPRPAGTYGIAGGHQNEYSTYPRVVYTQANPKYVQVLLPNPLGDDATGLPEEDLEFYSVSASDSIKYLRGPISFAFGRTNLAHEVNQVMGDNDTSATGATGVWSIAGRA